MLENFSVDRTVGVVVLGLLPLFTGCAQFTEMMNPHYAPKDDSKVLVTKKAPTRIPANIIVADNQPLKLMAVANDRSSITTDVVGIDNCKKTAVAFTDLKASFGTPTQVYASCLPKKGGDPIVSYSCSRKGTVSSCELK